MTTLALYTTMFPGCERYLRSWYESLIGQTDRSFQLWVGLDELSIEAARSAMGGDPDAFWVRGEVGDTPAQVRQRALEQIVLCHDSVVLVDSDDLLHPTRVAVARRHLEKSQLVGCALRLVNESGEPQGGLLALPAGVRCEDVLPRGNVFGLSNSAYRAQLLRQCLPIPPSVSLVDWYLATRAWLLGATMTFDNEVGMDYRQHGANMVNVKPPYTSQQIRADTQRVLRHYGFLLSMLPAHSLPERAALLSRAAEDADRFYRRVVLQPNRLVEYANALNALAIEPIWWSWVACPSLRGMWESGKEKP